MIGRRVGPVRCRAGRPGRADRPGKSERGTGGAAVTGRTSHPSGRRGSRTALVASAYPAALLLLSALHVVAPQRHGVLALTQILAPHLFVGLIPVLSLLLWPPARWGPLPLLSLSAALVAAVRFGPGLVSWPASETP